MIVVELGRENHGSIPATAIGRGLESLDARIDLQTRFNWWWKKKTHIRVM
jgi:hypothetical protein